MLTYLSHYQINKSAWDSCIYQSREGILYAYSWYLDIVSPTWDGIVWLEKGAYIAVMPFPIKKKYGITYIEQTLFAQQLGVFSIQKLSFSIFESFLNEFQKRFKLVAGYSFNTLNYEDFGEELFKKYNLPYQLNYTHHVDLSQSYEQIHKNYRRDTRYRLKKINTNLFHAQESENIEKLWDLFQNYTIPKINMSISPLANSILRQLKKELEKRKLSKLFFIYAANECRSGVLLAKSQNTHQTKWIYLFNAAMTLHGDESRRWFLDVFFKNNFDIQSKNADSKKMLFDFESAQEPQVADFYKSFGSEKKPFIVLRYNRLPFWVQWLQHKIWQVKQLKF